ncbi:2-C-methyl-D-erythritol 4-phosphate cytidylyltransferase [Bacteroidia bacterium]|nr:2-C-methyl-D-erythritol 4-phosphate cytidylyltransferase [Bacteroidia bacterium]
MKKYVIIVAGGSGRRMGATIPKQFLLLAGKPVLMHTIEAFHRYDAAINIILVLPESQQDYWRELCTEHNFRLKVTTVAGGASRFMSVKNGLANVQRANDALVAIQDGVRPLVTTKLIRDVFEAAEKHQAAYAAVQVVDTLRKIELDGHAKEVDRSQFKLVQTPQAFLAPVILDAYDSASESPSYTDDISVVVDILRPFIVEGSKENIKITTPEDLELAEAILLVRNLRLKTAITTACRK